MSKLTFLAAIMSRLRVSYPMALLAVSLSSAAVGNNPPSIPESQDPLMSADVMLGSINTAFEPGSQSADEWLSRYWSFDFSKDNDELVSDQAPKNSGFGVDNQS